MARSIGIFGGSFNPVHHGHLVMAQDVMERFELDRFMFMPCRVPPHKGLRDLVDPEHRAAMLELVIEENPCFELSRLELERPGLSYTVDTLEELSCRHPHHELRLVIGSDSLLDLHKWHRVEALLKLCRPITVLRPGYGMDRLEEAAGDPRMPRLGALLEDTVQGHLMDIASSDIRMRVAEGMSIRYLVPPVVEMYIFEHGLYRT